MSAAAPSPRPVRAPPVAGRHPVLLTIGAWTAVAVVLAAQTQLQLLLTGRPRGFGALLLPSLAGCAPWALYTPGLVWLARRVRALRARLDGGAALVVPLGVHVLVGGALATADAAVWAVVAPHLGGGTAPWGARFATALLLNAFLYTGLMLFVAAADHATRAADREREAAAQAARAASLQAQLDAARLRALEAQLRPHFLHNTLNVIAELVHEAPDRADAMLTQLGALLRRGLRTHDVPGDGDRGVAGGAPGPLVPFAEEREFVRAYGALLGERFGARVQLAWEIAPGALVVPVPAYLLQPLVENAFEHGVRRRAGATRITIRAWIDAVAPATRPSRGATADGPGHTAARLQVRVHDEAVGGARGAHDGPGDPAPARPTATAARDAGPGGHGTVTAPRAAHAPSWPARDVAPPAFAAPAERGVGLRNTGERLRTLYGDQAGLALERVGDATTVAVWLPLEASPSACAGTPAAAHAAASCVRDESAAA